MLFVVELHRSDSKKAKLDRAEQYYKREADWKEAGEGAESERASVNIADNISGLELRATVIIRNILYYS